MSTEKIPTGNRYVRLRSEGKTVGELICESACSVGKNCWLMLQTPTRRVREGDYLSMQLGDERVVYKAVKTYLENHRDYTRQHVRCVRVNKVGKLRAWVSWLIIRVLNLPLVPDFPLLHILRALVPEANFTREEKKNG